MVRGGLVCGGLVRGAGVVVVVVVVVVRIVLGAGAGTGLAVVVRAAGCGAGCACGGAIPPVLLRYSANADGLYLGCLVLTGCIAGSRPADESLAPSRQMTPAASLDSQL